MECRPCELSDRPAGGTEACHVQHEQPRVAPAGESTHGSSDSCHTSTARGAHVDHEAITRASHLVGHVGQTADERGDDNSVPSESPESLVTYQKPTRPDKRRRSALFSEKPLRLSDLAAERQWTARHR